jgi:hypothetical protein
MSSKTKDTSLARAGFAESVGASKIHTSFRLSPDKIVANHEHNTSRSALYVLAEQMPELTKYKCLESPMCCFTRAQVLKRAESLLEKGQETAIKISRTRKHTARLKDGYLRHIAALYLLVTGQWSDAERLRCEAVEEPSSPETQLAVTLGNVVENKDRTPPTPIDDAWCARRLLALQRTQKQVAQDLGCKVEHVRKLLDLLTLDPSEQIAVHEGRKTMETALREAKERGQGREVVKRPGVGRTVIRKRDRSARPTSVVLGPEQVDALVDILIGDIDISSTTDPNVIEFARYLGAGT